MNINFKVTLLAFFLVLVVGIISKQGLIYAQKPYPGVTIPSSKVDDSSEKVEKKGYRGLISGSQNYKPRVKPQTRTGISTYRKQTEQDKERKKASQRLQDLSKLPYFKNVQKLRAESEARAKKAGQEQNKLPQTGDITLPASVSGAPKLKPLDSLNMAVAREDYKITNVEDRMLEHLSLPPIMIKALMKNTKTKDGMSMTEKTGEVEILELFKHLELAKNESRKKRKKIYEQVEDNLEEMELRYQQQRDMPNRILLKLGLPQVYIDRKAKELDSVLDMIYSAQKEMRKYR